METLITTPSAMDRKSKQGYLSYQTQEAVYDSIPLYDIISNDLAPESALHFITYPVRSNP